MGFSIDSAHARSVMHAGIANSRFPLTSVAGKTFPAFQAHARPAKFDLSGKRPIDDKGPFLLHNPMPVAPFTNMD